MADQTNLTNIYRCPSCENFFPQELWSEDNDICIICFDEMESHYGNVI